MSMRVHPFPPPKPKRGKRHSGKGTRKKPRRRRCVTRPSWFMEEEEEGEEREGGKLKASLPPPPPPPWAPFSSFTMLVLGRFLELVEALRAGISAKNSILKQMPENLRDIAISQQWS